MAKVPDLGSDFAQKLLLDLRRRRERLGFESAAAAAQRTSSAAAPRDAYSSSRNPLRSQKPQQGAPRVRRPEATTHRSQQQSSNAIVRAGKPRHAHSHDLVPFQGGGGGSKHKPANNMDVQMALALALSNSGKLQNIELVARNGSVFFRAPDRAQTHRRRGDYLLSPSAAHVGNVAIGVQKLNDILMAYSSGAGARGFGRRGSVEIGEQLFRGAMDLEESLSMLVMLQDASDYMEGPGNNGKVLLLKGKENRKISTTRSTSSARLVEIVDEDSEAEQAMNGKSTSNGSMQIVAHKKSHGHSPYSSSVLQFDTVPSNSKISDPKGEKDGSKVRVPNVIAKLMGLENLPSAKAVAAHKGTEKFVKPEAVGRKEVRANAMGSKLPIRIVASERVLEKGQHNDFLAREWKTDLTSCEESEGATALSSSTSLLTSEKQVSQTMKQVLRKMESTGRRGGESQGVNGRIIDENRTSLTEEIKPQKSVSVGCRSDGGKRMDFLRRFRKNSDNKPATEEKHKHTTQEKSRTVGNKQATSTKQLLGRDSETKSRRTREKLNKENLASTEIKGAGKNGKTDQMKRPAHNKQIDKQSAMKKAQNYREMRSETPSRNLQDKQPLNSEAAHRKKKLAYTVVTQKENDKHTKVNDIGVSKLSDIRHGDFDFSEQPARVVRDNSTTVVASSNQSIKQITEEINDPTIAVKQITEEINVPTIAVVQTNDDSKVLDLIATAEINCGRINHVASETTQTLETFTEGEQLDEGEKQQQLQQQMTVKEQLTDGLDHTTASRYPTDLQDHEMHVVSCDSFTENQLLLTKMLLKDQYLLETAKSIIRAHVPVNFVNVSAGKWSDKGNDLLSEIGMEVIRRKGKRTEAMVEVSMTRNANLKLQYLDDLIRELDGDIESLSISRKPHQQSGDSTAESLQMILHRDIQNNHPDANSTWDFGWNRVSDLPIETNEVIKDLEKNILGGIITDVARELIDVSVRHGCCLCEA